MSGTRAMWLVAGLLSALAMQSSSASVDDWLTTSGDVLEIALPLAAAACATRQHRLASYATGFLALTAATQGLKYGFGDASINQRPNGQSHGFPSGHAGAAASGATDLAVHCAPGNRAVAAAGAAAVALVAGSRVGADEHTVLQVLVGVALGALSTGIQVTSTRRGGFGLSYEFHF